MPRGYPDVIQYRSLSLEDGMADAARTQPRIL
jgi:hypothetical protein